MLPQCIKIPQGNYYSDGLVDIINNIFINTGNGLDFLIFDINEQTSHCIFRARTEHDVPNFPAPHNTANANSYYSPNFKFDIDFEVDGVNPTKLHLTVGWMLGFNKIKYTVETNDSYTSLSDYPDKTVTYNNYIESEASYGRSLTQYIFIDIDDFNKNFKSDQIISSTMSSFIGRNIIARLGITNSPNNIIYADNSGIVKKERNYLGPVKLEKIHIRLLDKYGDIIDINNNDFSFALEFDVLYS